ncbi:hypothetical protein M011DRAFT_32457 [Sporormia fimetaria CBS 119925]|uniref:Uncharacterized protein n=1 Tax=Sporormia fimetaria CBS 119925 TaxID=1340428 RepID=A0A6A6VE70_9PLEO|nr:hypothetical protein M011DRAFT_32457 [Sporormia fimetaria CBS 119925]
MIRNLCVNWDMQSCKQPEGPCQIGNRLQEPARSTMRKAPGVRCQHSCVSCGAQHRAAEPGNRHCSWAWNAFACLLPSCFSGLTVAMLLCGVFKVVPVCDKSNLSPIPQD